MSRRSTPSDRDPALVGVVQPHQQVDERGLAGAGVADDADQLARFHLQGDVLQHRFVALVAEYHGVEAHPSFDPQAAGTGRVGDLGRLVDDLEYALRRAHRFGEPPGESGDHDERPVDQHRVLDELHELAQLHLRSQDQVAPAQKDQELPGAHDEGPGRYQDSPGTLVLEHGVAQLGGALPEATDLRPFAAERLDHADAGQNVLQQRVDLVEHPVLPPEQRPHAAPHAVGQQHHHRHRDQHQRGQAPLAQEEDHGHADQQEYLRDAVGEPEVDEHLDPARVPADPVQDVAGVAGAQVCERLFLHVGEHHAAQIAGQAGGDLCGRPLAQGVQQCAAAVGQGQRTDQRQHAGELGTPRRQVVVDQDAGELGRQQRQQCVGPEQDGGHHHPAELPPRDLPEPAHHGRLVRARPAHPRARFSAAAAGGTDPFVRRIAGADDAAFDHVVEGAGDGRVARRVAHRVARQRLRAVAGVPAGRRRLGDQAARAHHVVREEPFHVRERDRPPAGLAGRPHRHPGGGDHGPAVAVAGVCGEIRRQRVAHFFACQNPGDLAGDAGGQVEAQPHRSPSSVRSTERSRRV